MDPLTGVDGVAWASLHGAYRSAEDVPDLLAALRSPEDDRRRTAVDALWGAVVHQGTRWQVSSHVLPFLVRLVDDPATPDRATLVTMVRDIALGSRDDRDLPFDADATFGGLPPVTKEQEDLVIERVYHLEDDAEADFEEDWVDIADACARAWEADAYRSAEAQADAFLRWLADGDAEVAARAAELLAWFPPTGPTVEALLSSTGNASVRASANLALAHLDLPSTVVAPMTAMLDDDAYIVRLTSAIALAYRMGTELPGRALDLLIDAKEREVLPAFPPGWQKRAPRGYAAMALQRLGLS